jgi:hypothetical protein
MICFLSRPALCLAAVILLAPRALAAQSVQGRLLAATDDAPIAGALVQLTDSAGTVVARAASTASGGFVVAAPGPGTYQLVVRQIGRQSWRSDAFTLGAAATEPLTLRIAPQVYTLPEITVAARRPRCGVGLDDDDLLGRLLEAAGTALGVAEATADGGEVGFSSDTYLKRLTAELAVEDSADTDMPGLSRWPIQSAHPDSLSRWGFVRSASQGPVYYGPDARVLFSDWFLATHCFMVDTAIGDQVVVRFEPQRRGGRADLSGRLLLDRASLELRSLGFEYVGLQRWVPKGKAGGELRLSRLPGGAWVPTAWQLRAPVARRVAGRTQPKLGGWVETGGRVTAVRGRDGRVDSTLTAALLGVERSRRY